MTDSNLSVNIPQLGYFLTYSLWEEALNLLDFQLQLKENNRHFCTLSMFYYERLGKSTKKLKKKRYFNDRIANNLFYGLEKEFAIFSYNTPKSNLGLRKYKFFTYPMRAVYYAVGLYLVQLAQQFIEDYKSQNREIYSNYGGKLLFDADTGKLQLPYDSVWYKRHYKLFRSKVRREVKGDVEHKIVIRLDIQNYFDEIPVSTLLDLLSEYIKPSIKREMRYDAITKLQITSFFDFMANERIGIPQADNNIISAFIGYLYLVFGDLFIDQEIQRDKKTIERYAIIRYVDDWYISVTFNKGINSFERETYINFLASRIADCINERLGLRLNPKTKLYWLNVEQDREDLLRNLKKVSPGYEIPNDEDKENPNTKIERIFRQLEDLKKAPIDSTFKQRRSLDEEILKEVYDKRIGQLLKKPGNKARLGRIFDGFNFDLVIAQPTPITILLLQDIDASKAFERFLLGKTSLTSRDVWLILSYLCQTNFQSQKLISALKKSTQMREIIKTYQSGSRNSKSPGYYSLKNKQVLRLAQMHNVIEQIRLRILRERNCQYSVALNHLLNEIHAICYWLDKRELEEKKYDATRVVEFLVGESVSNETRMKIQNLFDRRNKNPVSHADPIAWPVTGNEYLDYRAHVGECLKHIL